MNTYYTTTRGKQKIALDRTEGGTFKRHFFAAVLTVLYRGVISTIIQWTRASSGLTEAAECHHGFNSSVNHSKKIVLARG